MSKASHDPQPLSKVAVIDGDAMADILYNVNEQFGSSIGVAVNNYMRDNPVSITSFPAANVAQDSDHRFISNADYTNFQNKVDANDPRLSDARAPITHSHSASDITGTAVLTNDIRLSDARIPITHSHDYEPANVNIQTHVNSTHAPVTAQKNSDITKEEIEAKLTGVVSSHSHAGGSGDGFIINVQALTSSPTDSQTVYFGMLPKAPTTTANISKIYIRKDCTLKMAEIYCYSGTAGTAEAWSLYVRKNNTTDTLIKTLSVNTNERIFNNSALNIPLVAGDYLEIKGVQPLWATNPLTCIYGGYLYFE